LNPHPASHSYFNPDPDPDPPIHRAAPAFVIPGCISQADTGQLFFQGPKVSSISTSISTSLSASISPPAFSGRTRRSVVRNDLHDVPPS
jgi:hypothetical protein